jgi:hypothetical protein
MHKRPPNGYFNASADQIRWRLDPRGDGAPEVDMDTKADHAAENTLRWFETGSCVIAMPELQKILDNAVMVQTPSMQANKDVKEIISLDCC